MNRLDTTKWLCLQRMVSVVLLLLHRSQLELWSVNCGPDGRRTVRGSSHFKNFIRISVRSDFLDIATHLPPCTFAAEDLIEIALLFQPPR